MGRMTIDEAREDIKKTFENWVKQRVEEDIDYFNAREDENIEFLKAIANDPRL